MTQLLQTTQYNDLISSIVVIGLCVNINQWINFSVIYQHNQQHKHNFILFLICLPFSLSLSLFHGLPVFHSLTVASVCVSLSLSFDLLSFFVRVVFVTPKLCVVVLYSSACVLFCYQFFLWQWFLCVH